MVVYLVPVAVTAEPKWQSRSFIQETADFELSVLHELLDGETVVLRRETLSPPANQLLKWEKETSPTKFEQT